MFKVGDYCIGRCSMFGVVSIGKLRGHTFSEKGWFTLDGRGFNSRELQRLTPLDIYLCFGE